MAKTRVEINKSGFNELRKDPQLVALIESIAKGIAEDAGEGYEYDSKEMQTRTIASVVTATDKAKAEAEKSGGVELLRALQNHRMN